VPSRALKPAGGVRSTSLARQSVPEPRRKRAAKLRKRQ
jgi:hypothetical protein